MSQWQGLSVLTPHGSYDGTCGYCKGALGSEYKSFGTRAERLTCADYQAMLDRGWRRSGKFLYLPDN